jgi:hypothetical protein
LHLAEGKSQDAGTTGTPTRRVPESTPTISATDANTRVRCPAAGSLDAGHAAGHIEM